MRVVSGKARGTKLKSVPGDSTRPILDRVKTALFDILRPELAGLRVLDLFAGTGSVGIEALSQGAAFCTFLDISEKAIATIRENVAAAHLEDQSEIRHTDAFTYMRNTVKQFDLIYIAPPQYKTIWIEALHCIAERPDLLTTRGKVIVQIDPKEYEPISMNALAESAQRKYGSTLLVFFSKT